MITISIGRFIICNINELQHGCFKIISLIWGYNLLPEFEVSLFDGMRPKDPLMRINPHGAIKIF